jgi:hypothetical protein
MGAASLTLSCGTTAAPTGGMASGEEDCCAPDDPIEHLLEVRDAGQYMVVEVVSSTPHSYRGRLEVMPGDSVRMKNASGYDVLLMYPMMRGTGKEGAVTTLASSAMSKA